MRELREGKGERQIEGDREREWREDIVIELKGGEIERVIDSRGNKERLMWERGKGREIMGERMWKGGG